MPTEEKIIDKSKKTAAPKEHETGSIEEMKAQLASQQRQIEILTKTLSGEPLTIEEPAFREVGIKMVEGDPVIDCLGSEVRGADSGAENLYLNLVVDHDGELLEKWVPFKTLHFTEVVIGKIIKEEIVDKSYIQGTTEVSALEGFRMRGTGAKVPLKVTIKQPLFHVELPGGRVIKARKVNV